jgi:ketopantoate reductase
MTNQKLHFLIMGAGVVGQTYGAHLNWAGHPVTFLTRRRNLYRFQQEGITLYNTDTKERLVNKTCAFITEIDSLQGVDCIVVCFRSDQRSEAVSLLNGLDHRGVKLVIAFPFWAKSEIGFEQRFPNAYYLFPGIGGIYQGSEVHFRKTTTKVSPLFQGSSSESKELAALLTQAGLTAMYAPNLMNEVQLVMAVGFPLLAALSTKDYNLKLLAKDKAVLPIVAKAQKECVNILKANPDHIGLFGSAILQIPDFVLSAIYRLSALLLTGLEREIVEVHFKKVHRQTLYLLKELLTFQSAKTIHTRSIKKLLGSCACCHKNEEPLPLT